MALKKKYHPLWKLLKGSLKWLAGSRIFCSIFQRHDSQQKVASSAACVWQVGNKKRDAKSAGGEAQLDRWLGILSVSAEGEPEEEGGMSWGVFCVSAQCRAFWQGLMWVRGCLEPQESLSCLTSHQVCTLIGLVIRNLVIAALLALDSCFLASSSRLKSCLDPKEDNFFYWHFIDWFWPRVGSKITPSVAFPLEITLIVIIQSHSRGPDSRQCSQGRVTWLQQKCAKSSNTLHNIGTKEEISFPKDLPNSPVALDCRYLGGKSYPALLHDSHEILEKKIRVLPDGLCHCGVSAIFPQQKCYNISA